MFVEVEREYHHDYASRDMPRDRRYTEVVTISITGEDFTYNDRYVDAGHPNLATVNWIEADWTMTNPVGLWDWAVEHFGWEA